MNNLKDDSTSYMKVRTRGNSVPDRKPKVFFTCHPADFDIYFDSVCADFFEAYDCAIYYTADMTASIPEIYRETDLGSMHLLVIPVTWRLLSEPNRAMDSDYVFADSKKIHILPLMTQVGIDRIDNLYKKRFGMRQYLSPYTSDLTEVKYEEKLKKYLTSLFLDDSLVERIKKEFDAYIFLSYRKKDRHHANELMGLIHKNPMYRDVAIWYDEFLTPGENFNVNILNALDKCELFTLLVTPNLVNEQNYVQSIEYPKARDTGKKILPAEMVKTSRKELERMYRDIPPCINAYAKENLSAGILDALKGIALKSNNDDPEHNYLIGLAYRDGIDVEVNKEYAAEMLTIAAEGGIPEAMIALYDLYSDDSELTNNPKALYWAQRIYDEIENDFCGIPALEAQERFIKMAAESEEELHRYLEGMKESWRIPLRAMNNLVVSLERIGNKEKAYELSRKLYELCKEHLGECDLYTLTALQNMGFAYRNMGNKATAESLYQEAYTLSVQDIERNHDETCASLEALTEIYVDRNQFDKAIELSEKTVDIQCDFYGRNSVEVYEALKKLIKLYIQVGEHMKAFDLSTQMYEIYNRVFGVLSVNCDMIEMLDFVGNIKKIALKGEKKKCIWHFTDLLRLPYKKYICTERTCERQRLVRRKCALTVHKDMQSVKQEHKTAGRSPRRPPCFCVRRINFGICSKIFYISTS